MRSWWSEPQSAPGLVFADCIQLLHLQYKECNQFDFSINHLVMSMCKVISCVVEKGCLLWPVHSLGRTQLAFALLHFVLQVIIIRQDIWIYDSVLRFITLTSIILISFYVLTCLLVLFSLFISFIGIDKVLYFPFAGMCHRLYIYSFSN